VFGPTSDLACCSSLKHAYLYVLFSVRWPHPENSFIYLYSLGSASAGGEIARWRSMLSF